MATRKLYYENCHLAQFSATVTGCIPTEEGYRITLDATAFYPEGGGQACDLGTLGSVRVLDVQEQGEEVVHFCDGPLAVGDRVEGCIDWERRFDLMQQHSGEHILSGIICRRYGCNNAGFHVGKDVMEVDFDYPIPPADISLLEELANRAVWANLPVLPTVPDPQTLEQTAYRSKRALPWPVRIVQIPEIDSCACCGVHVAATGEIGVIKILSCVKFHRGVRLELVCGRRAMEQLWKIYDQNRQVSQLLSARPQETAEAAQKLLDALAAEKGRTIAAQKQLVEAVSRSYVNHSNVLHFSPASDSGILRELADRIAAGCTGWAAVFCPRDSGYGYCLASRDGDLRELGKQMTAELQGRGGGKPNFQQGSVSASESEIRAFFQKLTQT